MTALKTPDELSTRERFSRWADRHRKWLFAAPSIAFTALLLVIPLAWTLFLSFTDARRSVRRDFGFNGVENYVEVLTDTERFWPSVWRTFAFTGGALTFELILGMVIALLLWKPFRGQGIVRTIVLLPLVATPVAVGMMWRLLFEPNIGFVNEMLSWVGIPPQPWLADPSTSLATLTFVDIWQWTPMVALILLAGLTSLSEEPQEAARVDGANGWQRFWYITVPLMRPVIIAAVLLRGIDALKTFDILYATKGKGGGAFHDVETLNVYAYGLSFDYNEYGLASAVLILFFLIILAVIWVLQMQRKGKDS
ncbi:carbohydrate ABC transporter permease [Microbacterium aerolatum]|uniref:ABC transporter permease n=1 Tax=Microbacterium aerolatum TaxID=153731 RepID=A0A511AG63_9MICO|nr:sugar ABC transporter permease [Microbacterium aerolatum]GEK87134.1 ABC transporter permease [Microbacterium aerolatum]GGB36250.1 ABC transporter permease [Microbacterium aerolatum]